MEICEVRSKGERICFNKAIVKLEDIVCDLLGSSFYVCRKHKKEFLKTKHYKEL